MKLTGPGANYLDWNRVKDLVKPGITEGEYRMLVQEGYQRACRVAQHMHLVPGVDDMKVLHRLIFENVYDFAGSIRKPGERIWTCGVEGVPAIKIDAYLKRLEVTGKEAFERAGLNRELQTEAVALHHAAFKRIQPFLDGAGRTASAMLTVQIQQCFGGHVDTKLDARQYDAALYRAIHEGASGSHRLGDQHPIRDLHKLIHDAVVLEIKMAPRF